MSIPRVNKSVGVIKDGLTCSSTRVEKWRHTWADKVTAQSVAEVVEDAITVGLLHARVNVIARVSQLSNLLGKQFHALRRVAENYALVDLQLLRQGPE